MSWKSQAGRQGDRIDVSETVGAQANVNAIEFSESTQGNTFWVPFLSNENGFVYAINYYPETQLGVSLAFRIRSSGLDRAGLQSGFVSLSGLHAVSGCVERRDAASRK